MWGGVFKSRDWFYIVPVLTVAMALGLVGFLTCTVSECQTHSIGEAVFRTADLVRGSGHFSFGRDPWELVIAQLLMPLAFAVGAVKLVIQNMRRDLKVVLVRRMRGHAIVCGTGDTGYHIATHLAGAGQAVVMVALDNQAPNALACERRGIPVLQGDAMETNLLRMAGLPHADALYIACGSDAANIEIGLRALAASAKRKASGALVIMPELRNEWLYNLVQTHRAALTATSQAHFRLFNINANAARLLLRSEGFERAAVQQQSHPHLVLAGKGPTLIEILAQATLCNFAVPGRRLSATLMGGDNAGVMETIERRYPGIASAADIALHDNDFTGRPAWERIARLLAETPPVAVIADLDEEEATMKAALEFRRLLDAAGHFTVPVFARVWRQHRLGAFIHGMEATAQESERLGFFGDLASLTTPDQLMQQSLDLMAAATHKVHRDNGQSGEPDWNELPEMYKQSSRAFADHIPVKLEQIGLKLVPGRNMITLDDAEIEALAKAEHWRWCVEKRVLGWRYDAVRDDMRKHHPLLLDWAALPETAREANRKMVRNIPAIADSAGLSLQRPQA
jgi:hypothetical protein